MKQRHKDLWAVAKAVSTLKDAHEALGKLFPTADAAQDVWRDFYLRSTEVYRRVAEVDRGHHHEALYWATREREKGEEITRALDASASGGGGAGE